MEEVEVKAQNEISILKKGFSSDTNLDSCGHDISIGLVRYCANSILIMIQYSNHSECVCVCVCVCVCKK